MPSTRDIRRRIKSIKNTSQITKAMQMVAASKMRKAQQSAHAGRPYATLMNEVLAEVTTSAGDFTHPLMEVRPGERRAIIVVSTDKGLCGALNSNLLREVFEMVVHRCIAEGLVGGSDFASDDGLATSRARCSTRQGCVEHTAHTGEIE